jgi:diaminopimelate decarboxylase/aspartate kinase
VSAKWIVLKFGGTSVAGRPQWDAIASLAQDRRAAGFRVLLVCSAVAGVTDRLSELADRPGGDGALDGVLDLHRALGRELAVREEDWLPPGRTLLEECLENVRRSPAPPTRASLLAAGEWLSTRLGALFLQQQGLEIGWVDSREALATTPEPELSPARQWLSADCVAGPDRALNASWSDVSGLLITQGFVARSPDGRTALLGRGGSDTSAALLAGRLEAERLEIWTDVPGLFSADPRLCADARLLAEVDYAEALEMAASGASVIHPRSIRAAAENGTPIVIGDLHRPDIAGTRIGAAAVTGEGVKAVTCQDEMAVMLLQNLDARRQVGFLASVFGVFRRHGVSIDLVATSETTTTVALNKAANHLDAGGLDSLESDLRQHCMVERFDNCVCVNLVGRRARTALSKLAAVMRYFDDHPLLMVSQSANDLCLSLLVPAGDHLTLVRSAHAALIPPAPDRVFGVAWQQIQAAG